VAAPPELLFLDRRGRFRPLPGAVLKHVRANAWKVTVPRSEAVSKLLRKPVTPEAFDEALWLIDGVESIHSVGSAETGSTVDVSVLLP